MVNKQTMKLRPFSNGTDAMIWTARNCDICTHRPCYSKRSLENGFILGYISQAVAEWIGAEISSLVHNGIGFCELNDKCNHFNEPNVKKPKPDNEPKLF
jgi:hypothetical protein